MPPMFGSRPVGVLLVLAALVALLDGAMLATRYEVARRDRDHALAEQARHLRDSFHLVMDQTERTMLSIATLVAGDREVQHLFQAGVEAVASEGGGAGGPLAAEMRAALLQKVAPAWIDMQHRFHVRQLHFHLAPGSTSFLRVHQPDRFGDGMNAVRHTVVAANAEVRPQAGFETGRIYSGLRGVVPVFARDDQTGAQRHIGALEAGTSLDMVVATLDRRLDHGVAVLLDGGHVGDTVFDSFAGAILADAIGRCGCVVEAASRPGVDHVVARVAAASGQDLKRDGVHLIETDDGALAVTHMPLRDFAGLRDAALPPVGAVVFWRDASALQAAFRADRAREAVVAVVAFGVVMLAVVAAFRFGSRRFRDQLARKTAELAQAAALVSAKSAELERSNRELADFAHVVSHDLQEPLRSVSGFLTLARRRLRGHMDPDTAGYVDMAVDGSQRMAHMITDLLALSRVNTQGREPEPVAGGDVIAEALGNLAIAVGEAGARVTVADGVPVLVGDRSQLVRLFQNLIGNALKYRHPDHPPEIAVTWRPDGGMARFCIDDNGLGVPAGQAEAIFLPFRRLNPGGAAAGTGMGLAICRRIVARHGGVITAVPLEAGGTRLTFTLPLAAGAAAAVEREAA